MEGIHETARTNCKPKEKTRQMCTRCADVVVAVFGERMAGTVA